MVMIKSYGVGRFSDQTMVLFLV